MAFFAQAQDAHHLQAATSLWQEVLLEGVLRESRLFCKKNENSGQKCILWRTKRLRLPASRALGECMGFQAMLNASVKASQLCG